MTFDEEILAAFGEVGQRAMPYRYTLTNREFTGIMRPLISMTPANELGFETKTEISIMTDRGQFGEQPIEAAQANQREIVQVLNGPFAGKWVLRDLNTDLAHVMLTCVISE